MTASSADSRSAGEPNFCEDRKCHPKLTSLSSKPLAPVIGLREWPASASILYQRRTSRAALTSRGHRFDQRGAQCHTVSHSLEKPLGLLSSSKTNGPRVRRRVVGVDAPRAPPAVVRLPRAAGRVPRRVADGYQRRGERRDDDERQPAAVVVLPGRCHCCHRRSCFLGSGPPEREQEAGKAGRQGGPAVIGVVGRRDG